MTRIADIKNTLLASGDPYLIFVATALTDEQVERLRQMVLSGEAEQVRAVPVHRFYVTMTWENWPEGGSYGSIIEAVNEEEAEILCRQQMAETRAEGDEEYDEEYYLEHCADNWHVVNCWDVDDFCRDHVIGAHETAAKLVEVTAERDRLLAALKSCRLMMYAWKNVRANLGLPDDHGELNDTIAEIEAILATTPPTEAQGRVLAGSYLPGCRPPAAVDRHHGMLDPADDWHPDMLDPTGVRNT